MHLVSTYCGIKSSMALAVAGDISLGLRMTQLPAAIAGRTGARVRCKGKFHAPITNTVPKGSGCMKTVSRRVRGLFSTNLRMVEIRVMSYMIFFLTCPWSTPGYSS